MLRVLGKRERALSLWIQDRLDERPAVEWGTRALSKIRGRLGNDLIELFQFLNDHAANQPVLNTQFKKVWRLLSVAARENSGEFGGHLSFGLRQRLARNDIQPETVDELVELVRPRLGAEELSPWRLEETKDEEDPILWIAWKFKVRGGTLGSSEAKFGRAEMSRFSSAMALRTLERGTAALAEAYRLADELGWLDKGTDLPSLYVHRVAEPPDKQRPDSDENNDERDPDAYDSHFAPLVRLLSASFLRLVETDAGAAQMICDQWNRQPGHLFLRLAAFARWNATVKPGNEVAQFIERLDERVFWRWTRYPEVATLRALRWKDLPSRARTRIEKRLQKGPSADAFNDGVDLAQAAPFHRDHELARILDSGGTISDVSKQLVQERRQSDNGFPPKISANEPGAPGVRTVRVPEGDASKFDQIPSDQLLAALRDSSGHREFGQGNAAAAFGRTLAGKAKIIRALEADTQRTELADFGWELLLSYPPQKTDDAGEIRKLAERIAGLAFQEPSERFVRKADRLCYWLDQADEVAPNFDGAEALWVALLEPAADLAREKETNQEASNDQDRDLTMAALNEPLGHLLSMFLRRCPTMPIQGERPPLPPQFTRPLRGLIGRARELVANRFAVHMPYFFLAEREWLAEIVLEPMKSNSKEGDRLWEAFSRYGNIPQPELWTGLEPLALRRLTTAQISPDAKRRLSEMATLVWSWSKKANPAYSSDAQALRSTLAMADDDVRAHVAWHFQRLVSSSKEKANDANARELWPVLGKAFFKEVWPLEPTLQTAKTANHFAGVPGRVGEQYFEEAVDTVLPYLRSFEVWSLSSEFWLGEGEEQTLDRVRRHPEHTLRLLAASIDPNQSHAVMELDRVLNEVVASTPKLQTDGRMRALRRLAA